MPQETIWRIPIDTTGMAPGEYALTAFVWTSAKSEGYYFQERKLTVQTTAERTPPTISERTPGKPRREFKRTSRSPLTGDFADPNKTARVFMSRGVERRDIGVLMAGFLLASLVLFFCVGVFAFREAARGAIEIQPPLAMSWAPAIADGRAMLE